VVIYFLIYSQIWLKLPRDDGYFYIYLCMDDRQVGYKQKFLRKEGLAYNFEPSSNLDSQQLRLPFFLHFLQRKRKRLKSRSLLLQYKQEH
jgi:hypothetical protein